MHSVLSRHMNGYQKKIEFQKNIDAIQPLPMFWLFQYTCFLFLLAGSNYSLIKF